MQTQKTEIKIISDAPFNYTVNKASDPYQMIVELQNTALGEFRERIKFDRGGVSEVIPLVNESSAELSRLKITFTTPVDVEPLYKEQMLVLLLVNPESETKDSEAAEEYLSEPDVEKIRPFEGNDYVGEKINIDFQEADLVHIFRLIADISGYNIVVSPDVKGKFSMKLIDVPWDHRRSRSTCRLKMAIANWTRSSFPTPRSARCSSTMRC